MTAIILALAVLWIAAGQGRICLSSLSVLKASAAERFAYSGAIGLGVAAYAVMLIGLCGLLSIWPVAMLGIVMAVVGFRGIVDNSRDFVTFLGRLKTEVHGIRFTNSASIVSLLGAACLALLAGIAVLYCFKPPTGVEWDAISYHLADPRQFIMAHRVYSLPTEHHSNFPLVMEMLYAVGLLYNGYALANLMHLLMGVLSTVATFAFCRRIGGSNCAWFAILLYASTPVVFWESSVAYVEIGLGLYTTLAVFAAVRAVSAENGSKPGKQWVILSAICVGISLGIKYLALVPFGLVLVFIAFRTRSVRLVATYTCIALVIASPWYIKSAVVMQNPVYPYYYKLFPHSVYWSASRAAGYESEQSRFGQPHSLKRPTAAAANLLQAPWDLITLPQVRHGAYSNDGEFSFMTLIGGLCFALTACVLLRRRIDAEIVSILLIGAVQFVGWFFVAQVSRYLVSILPLFAVTGAYGLSAMMGDASGDSAARPANRLSQAGAALGLTLLTAQVCLLLWVLFMAPPHSGIVTIPQLGEVLETPGGVEETLTRHLDTYAVTAWINKNTNSNDGVVLYEDTRGFYIDRKYMWGNEEHSSYIPYAEFKDGREMTDWMTSHGYRYAMIDMNWAPQNPLNSDMSHPDPQVPDGPRGHELEAFTQWYAKADLPPVGYTGYRWRGLLADAYRRGLWTEMDTGADQHGVILLHISPSAVDTR